MMAGFQIMQQVGENLQFAAVVLNEPRLRKLDQSLTMNQM